MDITSVPVVTEYSYENLLNCILDVGSRHNLKKFHFEVFKEYFGTSGHNASTIIVEDEYYSESYVSDLSLYYTYSNDNLSKYCKRIHLLKGKVRDKESFLSEILDLNNQEIINDYLGYIVVKPLPQTIIGATLLKTYDGDNSRHYNSIREYTLNLFGRRIKLNTLIFQEQDKNVAACATCAVWFASHYYVNKTNSPKLSLYEITKLAGSSNKGVYRMFPSISLDEYQVATAIRQLGLDFEPVNKLANLAYVKAYLYSYNKGGTPILLGIYLPFLGYHLVTVVGYKIDLSIFDIENTDVQMLKLRSSLITKLYVHDEHTGPYARIEIIEDKEKVNDHYKNFEKNKKFEKEVEKISRSQFFLLLNWSSKSGEIEQSYGIVKDIFPVIPPIIRISYKTIFKIVQGDSIREFLKYVSKNGDSFIIDDLMWDIYLYESNSYKEAILKSSDYDNDISQKLLCTSFPKYIWIARGYHNNLPNVEFVFDATGLHTNFLGRAVILIDKENINFDFLNNYAQIDLKYSSLINKYYFHG